MTVRGIGDDAETNDEARAWGRTAVIAGAVGATGLLLQTVLFLIDAAGVLPYNPPFRETGAGRDQDLAAFFLAQAERQHDIAWDIALRDAIGPVAAIALIVLARAVVRLRGQGRARAEVWALVFAIGAVLKLLSDLTYLSQLGVWRAREFTPEPPADIIAVGRSSDSITHLADYLEHAAFVILAAGLAGLAMVWGARLRLLAFAVATGLLVSVVAALADLSGAYAIATLLTGVALGPALLIGVGRSLAVPVARGEPGRTRTS